MCPAITIKAGSRIWLYWLVGLFLGFTPVVQAAHPTVAVDYSDSYDLLVLPLGPGVIESTQTICSGSIPAAFSSTNPATGGSAPYQYQWQISTTGFNSGFSDIPGATGLTYSSPALTQTSYFRRAVSTINESAVYTDAVRVTVNPVSVGGNLSGGGTFCPSPALATLTLSGHTGSIIRWESSTTGDFSSNVTQIANTTTSQQSPIFSSITATLYFRALVQSGSCASVYSDVDTVAIYSTPVAGSISGSDTVCIGINSTLLTLSGHSGQIVRWESATSANFSGTVTTIANTTTSHTATNLNVATWFRAVLKNGDCSTVNSGVGFVKIDSASVGGSVSQNTAHCAGSNSTTLRLSGQRGSIIRWESATNSAFSTGLTTINHTLDSLVVTNLSTTTYYRAIVQNGDCAAAASGHSTITIFALPNAGTLSKDTTVCHGAHSFILSLAGNAGNIVRWESSPLADFSSNITQIANTSATQSVTNLTSATYYRVLVSENGPMLTCENYSNSIKVNIAPLPNGGTISGSDTVCAGTNSTQLSLSGFTGSISRWQSATSSDFTGTITQIAQTSSQLTATNLSTTTYYRAELVLGNCTAYSAVATVAILAAPVGGSVSGNSPFTPNLVVCSGTNSSQLVLSGHTGTVIRWESALTADFSGTVSSIAHTGTSYTAVNLTQTTYFRAIVQQGDCDTARATPKVVTVVQPTVGGSISGGGRVCTGTNSTLLTVSGHSGSILRWESATHADFSGSVTQYANTTTTLTATNLTAKTYYRVWLRAAPCDSTTSATDSILIDQNSVGGAISGNDTVCHGTNSTLLSLSGQTGAIIRWESANNANFTGILTQISNTTATHQVTNLTSSTWYRAVVKNGSCPQAFSTPKGIIVRDMPQGGSITGGAVTVCINTNSTLLTLNNAVGNIIRWESCPNFDFTGPITTIAHTGSTYLATNLSVQTSFRVVVQVADCAPVTSAVTFINVQQQPNGGAVVGGGTLCTGTNSIQLTLVGHQGNIVGWESSPYSDFSANVTSISQTSTTLNLQNLTSSSYYRALVRYLDCTPIASATTQVVVNALSVGGTLSTDSLNRCPGANQAVIRLQNRVGSIVKWQSAPTANFSGTVTDIVHTADTLVVTNLQQTTYYRVIVQNGNCPADTSDQLGVVIQASSAAGSLTGSSTVCSGTNSILLLLTARTGSVLKWQSANDANFSSNLTDIAHTGDSLTVTNLTTSRFYRVIVQNGLCAADTSNSTSITVQPLSVGGSLSGGTSVCSGTNSTLLILSGRTGSILKWQWASDANFNANLTDIAHTGDSLTVTNLTTSRFYRVIVQNGLCAADTSNSTSITVQPLSVGGSLSGGTTVCSGTNSTLLILSGRTGSILKWQWASDANFNANLTDIAHTGDSLTVTNLTSSRFYRVIVQNGLCAADTSSSTSIAVQPLSVGGSLGGSGTVCSGTNSTLLILSGRSGNVLKWQWANDASFSSNLTDIAHTGDSLTVTNLTASRFYRVIVQNGLCAADTSNSTTITVQPLSVGGSLSGGTTVCSGTNSTLLILSGRTGSILKWQWASDANFNANLTDIAHTGDSLTVTNLTSSRFYRVIVQNGICAADTSTSTSITVQPLSVGGSLSGGTTVCSGTNSTLLILSGRSGNILKWQWANNVSFSSNLTDIAHTSDSLTVTNLTSSRFYRVIVQNGLCAADTSFTDSIRVLSLIALNQITGPTPDSFLVSGDPGPILGSVPVGGDDNYSYQWLQSVISATTGFTPIAGANSRDYDPGLLTQTHWFRRLVSSGSCPTDSSAAVPITIFPLPPSLHPRIGLALSVDEPIAISDETYRISYRYTLQNYGDGILHRIRMTQNLETLFPPPATFSLVQLISGGQVLHNPGFDGRLQTELTDSNSSQLAAGQSASLILEIDVSPNLPLATYLNQITALASVPGSGLMVSDISTLGNNPDPNGDGLPAESEPTPVSVRLFVPNGFSPNGDGENDAFVIKGIEKYPNNRIEIYNRWGNKIYEAAPYDNSWTGTAIKDGAIVLGDGLLPNGTYFYVLDFGIAGIAPQNGFVVIKK